MTRSASVASWNTLDSAERAEQLKDEGLPQSEACGLASLPPESRIEYSQLTAWQELGRGHFGTVWRCEYVLVRDTVAVKELKEEAPAGSDERMRQGRRVAFIREIRNANHVRHNSIVNFYGWTMDPVSLRLLMITELCSEDLPVRLRRRPLPWDECLGVATAVARAALYIHSRAPALVHMDIAARNVLLTSGGAKLGDLGLCTRDGAPASCVSVLWAPPELLAARRRHASTTIDVWAFGVLLWELLHRPRNIPYEWLRAAPSAPPSGATDCTRVFMESVAHAVAARGERLPIPPGGSAALLRPLIERCWLPQQLRPDMGAVVDELRNLAASVPPEEAPPAVPPVCPNGPDFLQYPYLGDSAEAAAARRCAYVSPDSPVCIGDPGRAAPAAKTS